MSSMTGKPRYDALLTAGKILTIIIQGLMLFVAVLMLVLVPVMLAMHETISGAIVEAKNIDELDIPAVPLAAIFATLAITFGALFVFFGKLRHIINSVAEGVPFEAANADRLTTMGWILLAVELVPIFVCAMAEPFIDELNAIDGVDLSMDFGIDLSSILMILVIFILARVFRIGSEMERDLEGTV